ncbi:MAG: phosphate-starvation-inducible PsiE family protein [Bradyrhizobium sp.]
MTERTREAGQQWGRLSLYHKFEHLVIGVLTVVIAGLVLLALRNLVLKFASIAATGIDPTDYAAFQAVFGMIFTVINIALEFERSLLVLAERERGIVLVRTP